MNSPVDGAVADACGVVPAAAPPKNDPPVVGFGPFCWVLAVFGLAPKVNGVLVVEDAPWFAPADGAAAAAAAAPKMDVVPPDVLPPNRFVPVAGVVPAPAKRFVEAVLLFVAVAAAAAKRLDVVAVVDVVVVGAALEEAALGSPCLRPPNVNGCPGAADDVVDAAEPEAPANEPNVGNVDVVEEFGAVVVAIVC